MQMTGQLYRCCILMSSLSNKLHEYSNACVPLNVAKTPAKRVMLEKCNNGKMSSSFLTYPKYT